MNVVGEADNGRAALLQARELQPDVIIMDVSMPESERYSGDRASQAILSKDHGTGADGPRRWRLFATVARSRRLGLCAKKGSG